MIALGRSSLPGRGGTASSRWLGIFLAALGPVFILLNLARPDPVLVPPALYVTTLARLVAAAAAALALLLAWTRDDEAARWRALAIGGGTKSRTSGRE